MKKEIIYFCIMRSSAIAIMISIYIYIFIYEYVTILRILKNYN